MRLVMVALIALLGALGGASAQVISEDFATYPEGVLYGTRWEFGGLGWAVRGRRLVCEGGVRSTALPASAPYASRMTFEAVMRPERTTGTQWKTAGISIALDDANHWQLALVEGPEAAGKPHSLEMHEMLKGRWLANLEGATALRKTVEEGAFSWEFGRDYRLRMELDPEGISGSVEEIGSQRVYRVGYAFSGDCVRTGRPMLATSAMTAAYAAYRAEILGVAGPPKLPEPPAYARPPMSAIRSKATGFFRVEKIGPRWWVMDPKGHAFYVVGTDHVNYNAHWCEKLGYAPYSRNVQAKFGSEDKWAASAVERLKAWGFNTLGAGHSESTRHRGLVHTAFLSLGTAFTAYGDIAPRTTWTGFPDVFDPRFAQFCAIEARKQCAPHRNDPWLLGYFLDNELEWFGKNGTETGLVDETMKKPADHPAKRAFVNLMRERRRSVEALNKAWGASFASWDELAAANAVPSTSEALKDRQAFVRLIAERYFSITCAAIRQSDPNHMILGCRFAGFAPPIWDIAGRHLDIVSVNYYGNVDFDRNRTTDMPAAMARYHRDSGRPLLITEWSFPALDAGLPSRHGAGQRVPTQRDKARAYAIYQTALFAMPCMVGSNYFMWVDEPELGISSTFPEDSNYGLVDVNDRPWPELTAMAAKLNPRAVAIHSGRTSEVSAQIGKNAVTVRNAGAFEARFAADVWVQGKRTSHRLTIPPGRTRTIPLRVKGLSLVVVELDRAGALIERRLDDNRATRLIGPSPTERSIVVVNAGDTALTNVPVSVGLPSGLRTPLAVHDSAGRPVAAQTDLLPSGPEIAFLAPSLPAGTASVFALKSGGRTSERRTLQRPDAFSFRGVLQVDGGSSGRNLADTMRLEGVEIGRLTVLIHQTNGQPLWIEPSRIGSDTAFVGPVRTVRLVEMEGGSETAGARTEALKEGEYAPRTARPHAFRAAARMDCYPGEGWLDVRLLNVTNLDKEAWNLESYFVYPVAAIRGSAKDDVPGGPGDAPRWYDSEADVSYGAVIDTGTFRGYFWKDTPDGDSLHADIYRTVKKRLSPSDAFSSASGGSTDPAVRVFATKGDSAAPGHPLMARLKALGKLEVRLYGVGPSRGRQ